MLVKISLKNDNKIDQYKKEKEKEKGFEQPWLEVVKKE